MRYRLIEVSARWGHIFEREPNLGLHNQTSAERAFGIAVRDWLIDNLNPGEPVRYLLLTNTVQIRDPDDALAFRMRWC